MDGFQKKKQRNTESGLSKNKYCPSRRRIFLWTTSMQRLLQSQNRTEEKKDNPVANKWCILRKYKIISKPN